MVYVEQMNMRRSSKDEDHCVDYVQFGRNDIVPFFTVDKSKRYCGHWDGRDSVANGISFDEPGGDLLVWVSLGGRRQSSWWPIISVVNMTLVITTYQKECNRPKQNYRRCADRSRCIYNNYFCDRHFNCLTDKIPLDEDGCVYEQEEQSSTTESNGRGQGIDEGSGINSVTKTLVIVCSTLGVLLLLILWIRYRKTKRCCHCCGVSGGANQEWQDAQQQPRSLDELNRLRQLRGGDREENLYSSGNTTTAGRSFHSRQLDSDTDTFIVDPSVGTVQHGISVGGVARFTRTGQQQDLSGAPAAGAPPPDEPPPAYDELYPDRSDT